MYNISQFIRLENSEVIWHKREIAEHDANVNFFYAFCRLGEYFYSLHLNRLQLPYVTSPTHVALSSDVVTPVGQKNRMVRKIILSKYRAIDGNLDLLESNVIDSVVQASDPRIVSNGKKAWAVMHNELGKDDWGATLLDLCNLKTIDITFKQKNIKYGKNWQPFIHNDELFVVHELNPFRVLKINEITGVAEVVYEAESYLPIFSNYETYPLLRGGSNSIIKNDFLFGLGHTSSEVFRHHPFLWSHQKGFGTTVSFIDFFYYFTKHGYALIDPTSLFEDDESIYIGLDCHERDRQHEQKMLHILLKFNKIPSGNHKKTLPLLEFLDSEPITEQNGVPDLSCHRFFCPELPSAALYEEIRGVRTSIGVPGHIVHGPYLTVLDGGNYSAELSYFTKNDKEPYCGCFEVVVHKKNPDGSINVHCPVYLAQSQLEATSGVLVKKRLIFNTDEHLDKFLEFRVFANKDAIVSVCDIVTKNMG